MVKDDLSAGKEGGIAVSIVSPVSGVLEWFHLLINYEHRERKARAALSSSTEITTGVSYSFNFWRRPDTNLRQLSRIRLGDVTAASENIIRKAAGMRSREQDAILDMRFYIAIAATVIALALIAISKFHQV